VVLLVKKVMENKEKQGKTIVFHNKIASNFQEFHVDGAFGGVTPRGLISIGFFAERFPIPTSTEFSLSEGGQIGGKIKDGDDSKSGILREFQTGIFMDLNTARELHTFLGQKIVELETIIKQNQNAGTSTK
jgi:hypothetical protein